MKLQGIGNGPAYANGAGKVAAQAQRAKVADHEASARGPVKVETARSTPPGERPLRGVIRLLQEGHFKGVADVRLRINFFDELAAIEKADLVEAVREEAPGLLGGINAHLDALLASGELNEQEAADVVEAQNVFNSSVGQVVEDFVNGGGTDTRPLIDGLQMVFDALAGSLEPLLTSLVSAEDEPMVQTVGAGSVEGPEEQPAAPPAEASIRDTFVEELRGIFSAWLEEFQEALTSASSLPDLSEPSGNGVAYAKFLAMYNELRGVGGETEPPPEVGPVDTTA